MRSLWATTKRGDRNRAKAFPMTAYVGYARVSTEKQSLGMQIDALLEDRLKSIAVLIDRIDRPAKSRRLCTSSANREYQKPLPWTLKRFPGRVQIGSFSGRKEPPAKKRAPGNGGIRAPFGRTRILESMTKKICASRDYIISRFLSQIIDVVVSRRAGVSPAHQIWIIAGPVL